MTSDERPRPDGVKLSRPSYAAAGSVQYRGRHATVTALRPGFRIDFADPDLPAMTVPRWRLAQV